MNHLNRRDEETRASHGPNEISNADHTDVACSNNSMNSCVVAQKTVAAVTNITADRVYINDDPAKSRRKEYFRRFGAKCVKFSKNEYVHTRGAEKALNVAKRYRIVSVIGLMGDGKTAIAKYVVGNLPTEEYEVICVTSVKDWQAYVDPERKQIVFIDNIFGCVVFRPDKCDNWFLLHDDIMEAIHNGLHYIVVTSNKDYFEAANDRKYAQVFQYTVDLTSPDWALTPVEKKDIRCYLTIVFGDKNYKLPRESCQLPTVTIGFPGMCVYLVTSGLENSNMSDVPMQNLNKLSMINVAKLALCFKIGPFI